MAISSGGVDREYYKVNFCKAIFVEAIGRATKLFLAQKNRHAYKACLQND
jgi:hypothetical protein